VHPGDSVREQADQLQLRDALADEDHVQGVVVGSGVGRGREVVGEDGQVHYQEEDEVLLDA